MEEDPKKVQAKKDELNKGLQEPEWDDVIGVHAMSTVDLVNRTIDPGSGLTVKCFVNMKTWEIKTFFIKEFLKD